MDRLQRASLCILERVTEAIFKIFNKERKYFEHKKTTQDKTKSGALSARQESTD
jgi:hypothetical protein